jgi:hypothetical protein
MTDRPIIFSTPMVRALLEGRKTQTRRVLRPQPHWVSVSGFGQRMSWNGTTGMVHAHRLPYITGDRLWVREAIDKTSEPGDVFYRADYEAAHGDSGKGLGWRPSIHMPRRASRLTLTVTDVRVQRLHDISEADAVAEGVESGMTSHGLMWKAYGHEPNCWVDSARLSYIRLWDSLQGTGAWDANPWVVALTFNVEKRNIDTGDTP